MNNRLTPTISVLIATYNHEKYIRQAMDSVLMQQADFEFEIVIADDNSQDATLEIVKGYQAGARNIRILPQEKNLGITHNYQRGFAACRGEFVAVLEGDDFWISPTKLKSLVAFLQQHPECSFCFHRFLKHDEAANHFTPQPTFEVKAEFALYNASQLARGNFIGNFSVCTYRREIIRKLDPALFEMKTYDWMFNIAVAQEGPIGYLPEIMSIYRAHPGGIWSGNTANHQRREVLEILYTYNKYLNFKYDQEFQALSRSLHMELVAESETRQAAVARLRDQVKPFVPPVLVDLARRIYHRTRRTPELASGDRSRKNSSSISAETSPGFSQQGLLAACQDRGVDDATSIGFTAHNIRLDNGEYTKPEMGIDMSEYPRFLSARRILSTLVLNVSRKVLRGS